MQHKKDSALAVRRSEHSP